MGLDFLKNFEKEVDKMEGVAGTSVPPTYWFPFGNYLLNYIMSGSFFKGLPQGRLTGLAGPSGTGKSFLAANAIKNAQQDGAFNLVIDSENALDDDFVTKIGADPTKNYKYLSVTTIPQVTKIVSKFLKGYKDSIDPNDPNSPKVHITIDSLDMLMTETELDNYGKGVTKGDQGQRNKQLKAMLRTFVQAVKGLNITFVVTCQVYANQNLLNGEGNWIVSDAVRFSLSQILLLTKLKLKDEDKKVAGIHMKVEGFKTRFTKPFQKISIEVPYDEGMDPYSGLLDAAKEQKIVTGKGWYTIESTGEKLQKNSFTEDHYKTILHDLEEKLEVFFNVQDLDETVGEEKVDQTSSKKKRKEKGLVDSN